jgi:hypothetical protein
MGEWWWSCVDRWEDKRSKKYLQWMKGTEKEMYLSESLKAEEEKLSKKVFTTPWDIVVLEWCKIAVQSSVVKNNSRYLASILKLILSLRLDIGWLSAATS